MRSVKQLYERHSAAVSPDRLDTTLRAAIESHAEQHQLGDVLAEVTAACETHSVRRYRNGLIATITGTGDPDREHRTLALLTPRYLMIAVAGERRGIHVRSTRLETVTARTDIAGAVDSGIGLVARWSGATADQGDAEFFLGLGDDPSGRAFTTRLLAAVTSAKGH